MSKDRKSTLAVSSGGKSVRPKSCPNSEGQGKMRSTADSKHKGQNKSSLKSASSGYSSMKSLSDKQDTARYQDCYQDSSEDSESDESDTLLAGDNTRDWPSHHDRHDEDEEECYHPHFHHQGQKITATKRFKMEVMKRILEEFDLQKTLDYYANLSISKVNKSNGYCTKDYSPECAYQAELLRQRMVFLMGTDQVNINDRQYNASLREHIRQEYEAELQRAEKGRAEMERKRMHRLMKEGVITYEEVKDDPIFVQEWHKTKLKYGRTSPKRKGTSSKKPKRAQTAPTSEIKEGAATLTSPQTKTSQNPLPVSARKQPERPRTVQWESRKDRTRYKAENDDDELGDVDYMRWGSYNKYNDPWILKLQDEESVDGLYTIAEDLLEGKLPSQMAKGETKKKTLVSS